MSIIDNMTKGFEIFRKLYYEKDKTLFKKLVEEGQSPKVMMLTCADSRISTTRLTNSEPGTIFVVRNVANLVPSFCDVDYHMSATAALEYAVTCLNVEHVIVLGHSQCGGIAALMKGNSSLEEDNHIANWVATFEKSKVATLKRFPDADFETQCRQCEKQALSHSLKNLREYPWVKSRLEEGKLQIHAWYYHLAKGQLIGIDPDTLDATILAPKE